MIPPLCPRCGDREFESQIYRAEAPGSRIILSSEKFVCLTCRLAFVKDHWEDETGAEWRLAESGT